LEWGVADWLETSPPPHMCYLMKFGSSVANGVSTNRKEPQNWGELGPGPYSRGAADPLGICHSPTCYLPNLVVLGQPIRALLRRSS